MKNKEFSNELESRTKKFASAIIKLSRQLPSTIENNVIKNQITKSGTSIGANYREANRSRSKADFANKIRIWEFEASETVYWLELIRDITPINSEEVQENLKEAKEILAIFTSVSKTLRN